VPFRGPTQSLGTTPELKKHRIDHPPPLCVPLGGEGPICGTGHDTRNIYIGSDGFPFAKGPSTIHTRGFS